VIRSILVLPALVGFIYIAPAPAPASSWDKKESYRSWSLQEAVALLTNSPWATQETFFRVIGGIGSGVRGEKEIYSTFFVRILSARPIREAYARINQLQAGYDDLSREDRRRFDAALADGLNLDVRRWIVISLSFRSNDPTQELQVRQFLEVQTKETLKSRAFLSTDRFPQVELSEYFPPREAAVGAKFVFPRHQGGKPVVTAKDSAVRFELDIPGFSRDLSARFPVSRMLIEGEPTL
jgi:hypothetical protein